MRASIAILLLAVVLGFPGRAPADDLDEPITSREITRRQIEALHDLEQAETDEEAEEAMQRFDDASALEVRRRRGEIDELIEQGAALPRSPRPPAPHP